MQGASAFLIGGRVCMHADSTTVDGYGVAHEPAICVDDLTNLTAIGEALEDLLAKSRRGVQNLRPSEIGVQGFKFFLRAAKVRSWRALVSSAKHISIARDGTTVHFQPACREGQSYAPLPPDRTITVEGADAAQMGSTLLEAFDRCE